MISWRPFELSLLHVSWCILSWCIVIGGSQPFTQFTKIICNLLSRVQRKRFCTTPWIFEDWDRTLGFETEMLDAQHCVFTACMHADMTTTTTTVCPCACSRTDRHHPWAAYVHERAYGRGRVCIYARVSRVHACGCPAVCIRACMHARVLAYVDTTRTCTWDVRMHAWLHHGSRASDSCILVT